MTTTSSMPPAMDTINTLLFAVYPSFGLMADCQIDVFTPLQDGALTAEQLAERLQVGVAKLRPLLYALVAARLLTVAAGRFANTEESSHYLAKGQPAYMGKRLDVAAKAWAAMLKTAESIRAGVGQARQEFDFVTMPAETVELLLRGFHAPALATGRLLAERFDFSIIAPVTQRIGAESNVAERVRVVSADAVRESIDGAFDGAILSSVIQTMSADETRQLLKNVARVLNPNGALYVIGSVLDDSRLAPAEIATLNLLLINAYADGQAYTEGEYRAWLTEAGFEDIRREILPGRNSLISACKAA